MRGNLSHHSHPNPRAYLGVGFGVLVVSSAAVLIRLAQAHAHSLAIGAWRMMLSSVLLAPLAIGLCRNELMRVGRRAWAEMFLSGLLLSVHFIAWITSLALTSVAASVVLVTTYPLFVGLASAVLLKERPSRAMVIALAVGLAGSAIIALGDLGQGGTHRLWGDLLALVGAMTGAGYFLIGRHLRGRLSLLAYVFPVYASCALALFVVVWVSGIPALPRAPVAWVWLLVMALGPQILGHSALNWALRYLSATYVALAVLGEPIGATLFAWWILGEIPTYPVIVGGMLILFSIALASRAERESRSLL